MTTKAKQESICELIRLCPGRSLILNKCYEYFRIATLIAIDQNKDKIRDDLKKAITSAYLDVLKQHSIKMGPIPRFRVEPVSQYTNKLVSQILSLIGLEESDKYRIT